MTIDAKLQVRIAAAWQHGRKCKHAISECAVCQGSIRLFAELPLPTLSEVLHQPSPVRRFPLIDQVADKAISVYQRHTQCGTGQSARLLRERALFSRICEARRSA